jgi:hypothetical protein
MLEHGHFRGKSHLSRCEHFAPSLKNRSLHLLFTHDIFMVAQHDNVGGEAQLTQLRSHNYIRRATSLEELAEEAAELDEDKDVTLYTKPKSGKTNVDSRNKESPI